LRAFY